jgi:hemerythrin-like domain-containing protein
LKEGFYVTKGNQNQGQAGKNGLSELSNFVCVLRGDVKYLEKIREHIEKVYANSGLVTMIKSAVSSEGINLLEDAEWEEYQKLKKRDDRLIGAGFP